MLICLHLTYSIAQSPLNDLNWKLDTLLSDEFSGSTLNTAKWGAWDMFTSNWDYVYPSGTNPQSTNGETRWNDVNVLVGGGICSLRIDAPTAPAPYYWNGTPTGYPYYPTDASAGSELGGISTIQGTNYEGYHYGYLEIYAKLPGFIDGNGVAHGDKFWPAFWTYHEELDGNNCRTVHDEIDILEPSGIQYADAKTNVCGVWNETSTWISSNPPNFCGYTSYKVEGQMTSSTPLCSAYHKFAVEWNIDRTVYYFDDVPFFTSHDAGNEMDPMRVVIGAQVDPAVNDYYTGTPFPQYFMINYFKYYKLIRSGTGCSTSATILNNTDLTNYTWGVKSSITFGDGTGTVSLGSSDNKTFRAVNSITINGDFTVPLGAEFTAMPTPCN